MRWFKSENWIFLVQWSFEEAGITLPRTAQEQHEATKKQVEQLLILACKKSTVEFLRTL
ncbi:Cell wall hydrolase [Bacillus subtilis]